MVAIVVICILSLAAIPRMLQLQTYARIAKLKTLRASVTSASTIVHSALLVRKGKIDRSLCANSEDVADNFDGKQGTVCLDDGIINLVYGYPAVTKPGIAGILSAAGLTTVFNPTVVQIQGQGYNYVKAGKVAIFQVTGGSDNNYCAFTYMEASVNTEPFISNIITTGC